MKTIFKSIFNITSLFYYILIYYLLIRVIIVLEGVYLRQMYATKIKMRNRAVSFQSHLKLMESYLR